MSQNGQKWAEIFWNGANLSPNFKMGVAINRRRQMKIWAKRHFLSKYEVSRANGWGVTAVWKSRLKQGFFKILLWATGGRHRAGKDLKKLVQKTSVVAQVPVFFDLSFCKIFRNLVLFKLDPKITDPASHGGSGCGWGCCCGWLSGIQSECSFP